MDNTEVLDIINRMLQLTMQLALPMLLVSMVVGILIAIFQAATQINEQAMTFVPKLLTIVLILVLFGGNMLTTMQGFFTDICGMIARGG